MVNRITTMGGRAGGGAGGGGGTLTGMTRGGKVATFSLQNELSAYRTVEAQVKAEIGDKIAADVAKVPDARLQGWANYPKDAMGEAAVRKKWAEGVKGFKSGDYYADIVSFEGPYGKSLLKSYAQSKLMSQAAKKELARRRKK